MYMDNHFSVNADVVSVSDMKRELLAAFEALTYRNKRLLLTFAAGLVKGQAANEERRGGDA